MNAMFHDSFLNSFTIEDALAHLVNLASWVTARQEVEDITECTRGGHDLAKKFVAERLVRNEGSPV